MDAVRWSGVGGGIALTAGLTAVGMWLVPAGGMVILAAGIVVICAIILFVLWRISQSQSHCEADAIEDLDPERINELVRGTSMHLREMRFRYSVRVDRTASEKRQPFTADINSIRLGFIPVILTENETGFQGYGYMAFVYDDRRWRGPGLPCPDGRKAAISHARNRVRPVSAVKP